jgi:hypothetical protein
MPIFKRKNLFSHIIHPNQIGQQEFSYQIGVQQISGNYERFERHQTYF